MATWIGLKEIWYMLQEHVEERDQKDCCGCYIDFSVLQWKLVSLVLPKIVKWDSKIILSKKDGRFALYYENAEKRIVWFPNTTMSPCPVDVLHSYLRVVQSCATCEVLTKHIINLENNEK